MLRQCRVEVEHIAALVIGLSVFRADIVAGKEAGFRADLRAEPTRVQAWLEGPLVLADIGEPSLHEAARRRVEPKGSAKLQVPFHRP